MSAWTYRRLTARPPNRLFRLVLESHDGRAPGADSEEKHEPVSDIDTVGVDSLKALDPEWPIREATKSAWRSETSRSAITGREQMRQIEPLFDHLVGAQQSSMPAMGTLMRSKLNCGRRVIRAGWLTIYE